MSWGRRKGHARRASSLSATREADANSRATHASPALGDLDGDGAPELVVGTHDGALAFFKSEDGAAAWSAWPLLVNGSSALFARDARILATCWRAAPALVDVDGDGDLDLLLGSEDEFLRVVRNEGTSQVPRFETDASEGYLVARALREPRRRSRERRRVSKLAVGVVGSASGVIVVGDGGTGTLRYERLIAGGAAVETLPALDSPLAQISLDALNEAFPAELGSYAAPALADLNADGVADLVLGGLYGTLLFFDGAQPVHPKFTEDYDAEADDDDEEDDW